MARLLNQQIEGIKLYLRDVIYALFKVEYNYEKTEHSLSQREDFYVSINRSTGTFFIDLRDYIYFMPRRYANEVIYKRFLKKMEEDVARNLTNMVYNYKYKIRESMRSFKSLLKSEADTLKGDIEDLVNRVISAREEASIEINEKINELNRIIKELSTIIEEL